MARLPVAERRRRLLAAAFAVISRAGVAGATTRAVVEEAGMKLASFHYAFASREELLAELVDDVISRTEVVLEVPATEGEGLESLLERGLLRYLDGVRADPLRERAMFELTQHAMRTPGLEHLAARQYETYRAFAAGSLTEAAARTGCAWSRPVNEVAAELVALTDGLTLAWLAAGASTAEAAAARDARAAATAAFAARALAAEARPLVPASKPRPAHPTRTGSTA
ncbi:TetR/AcrR family transcriptional regulator [Herbiconiux liangxiaofengii]|uniref:TetR/AcrR family transcriptional regulator n=1 Tax=Herbiconiux liangxiaofengii TaxID=3342795 RepID=UPI0035BAF071